MVQKIKLIAGLGNPGSKYTKTRHNVGFWFVDALAQYHQETFRAETRFAGDVCKVNIDGQAVHLFKPTKFINRSGFSIYKLASFYKIPAQNILIVHDDLDLPVNTARLKFSGGHGGHNGLRDIHAQISKDYWRLRIGIGHPGNRHQVTNYVLSAPNQHDMLQMCQSLDNAADVLSFILNGEMQKAMNQLHRKP